MFRQFGDNGAGDGDVAIAKIAHDLRRYRQDLRGRQRAGRIKVRGITDGRRQK